MPIIPYAQRAITLQFQLNDGQSFGASGSNILTITGLRIVATFQNALAPTLPTTVMTVYGMTLDQMNKLTVAGTYLYGTNKVNINSVSVQAGIVNGPMATIFSGGIIEAYPDGNQPNMGFFIRAAFNPNVRFQKIAPTSFNGSVPAIAVMQAIANKSGIPVENNGVTAVLSYPYFAGPPAVQYIGVGKATNSYIYFDHVANKVAFWPKPNGSRNSSNIVVSPDSGMIGYPKFESGGISVTVPYDPSWDFKPGSPFQVESQFKAATGTFVPSDVTINLSSQMPKGPWEIAIRAYPQQPPVPSPVPPPPKGNVTIESIDIKPS